MACSPRNFLYSALDSDLINHCACIPRNNSEVIVHERNNIISNLQLLSTTSVVKMRELLDSDGLNALGVHDLMKQNPNAFRKLICEPSLQLNADYIINVFSTDFSEMGSTSVMQKNKL